MTIYYAIIGKGGFGRETMPIVKQILRDRLSDITLCFVEEGEHVSETCNGYPAFSFEKFKALPGEKKFNIAIGNSQARERISKKCVASGMRPFNIIAPNSIILDQNEIGEGIVLSPFTTITSNVEIGRFFQANIYSYVAHDCIIGDFVTFAPNVCCNGRITIEDHAYIGTGAVINPGTPENQLVIGHHAVVGMGAVVTKSVPPHAIVVGNPAHPIKKQQQTK